MTKPSRKIKNPKRTPAEEARDRLRPQEILQPQPVAAAPSAQPGPVYPKTTIEVINDRLAAIEGWHAEILKRVLVIEGHIAEIADVMLYSSGVLHAPPKIAETARRIVMYHQDKIRR